MVHAMQSEKTLIVVGALKYKEKEDKKELYRVTLQTQSYQIVPKLLDYGRMMEAVWLWVTVLHVAQEHNVKREIVEMAQAAKRAQKVICKGTFRA